MEAAARSPGDPRVGNAFPLLGKLGDGVVALAQLEGSLGPEVDGKVPERLCEPTDPWLKM